MNRYIGHASAVAISFVFSAGAIAHGMSAAEYKSAKDRIAAEYKSARAACASMSGAAQDSCRAEAKSRDKAAKAELQASYAPGSRNPSVSKKERVQEYVDDSVITAKVKAAVFEEPSLKSAEINVETNKGIVQLSGFVRSRTDINKAVAVARKVSGVTSVKNDMIVKGQQ